MDILIVQRLKKACSTDMVKAIKYYSILSVLNNLDLTKKQIELLAFTSVRGTITSPGAKREFIETFDSSFASLENIKNRLKRKGWIIKIDRKYRVNPRLTLDFSRDILLHINLTVDGASVS